MPELHWSWWLRCAAPWERQHTKCSAYVSVFISHLSTPLVLFSLLQFPYVKLQVHEWIFRSTWLHFCPYLNVLNASEIFAHFDNEPSKNRHKAKNTFPWAIWLFFHLRQMYVCLHLKYPDINFLSGLFPGAADGSLSGVYPVQTIDTPIRLVEALTVKGDHL